MSEAIVKPIHDFGAAWDERSGAKMALCFTEDANFVAYDGTRLKGGTAIGDWHQQPLDTVLSGTKMVSIVDEICMITPELALVLGSGGPQDATRAKL